MKRIKKFNELFDTEELKSQNEIPMLQGNLLPTKYRNVKGNKFQNDLHDVHNKMIYNFPWVEEFDQEELPGYKDMIFYHTSNDSWYISLSIKVEGDKCGFGIIYRLLDTSISPDNSNVKFSLAFSGKEYVYFKEWNGLDVNEMIRNIKIFFEPLMRRLGFTDELKYGNKEDQIRFN